MKVLILLTALTLSFNLFAESKIKACGLLTYEPTYERNTDVSRYTVYVGQYRFELVDKYLTEKQTAELTSALNTEEQLTGLCIEGYFAGDYSWTGFQSDLVDFSKLKKYDNPEEVEYSYSNNN